MSHPLYLITRYIKECGDNGPRLQQILDRHMGTFQAAKGSLHKHQAWPGGYLQHVADCMSLITMLINATGNTKYWPIPFTRASAMLVMFLHDIEKPFMQERMAADSAMQPWNKEQRFIFRGELIADYNIMLTEEEQIALLFVEGESDYYHPTKRLTNELGALCHAADYLSARLWHSRNKPSNEEP